MMIDYMNDILHNLRSTFACRPARHTLRCRAVFRCRSKSAQRIAHLAWHCYLHWRTLSHIFESRIRCTRLQWTHPLIKPVGSKTMSDRTWLVCPDFMSRACSSPAYPLASQNVEYAKRRYQLPSARSENLELARGTVVSFVEKNRSPCENQTSLSSVDKQPDRHAIFNKK